MEGLAESLQNALGNNAPLAIILVFIGGVLSSLTPCVYPMIPVTVSYIGARSGKSKLHGFILSVFFTLGIAITYSILGVLAALIPGMMFGQIASNKWTFFIIGNIILLLGLSMLGVFEFPQFTFLNRFAPKGSKAGIGGALLMGIILGFAASPCVGPILGVLGGWVSLSGNAVYGGILFFSYALGMGVLFIVLGTFAGLVTAMPKQGMWLNRIKRAFGIIMIIMAEYFLIQVGKQII